jgi:hypothetical protein
MMTLIRIIKIELSDDNQYEMKQLFDHIEWVNMIFCLIHRRNDDQEKALEFYNKTIEFFRQVNDENHPSMAYCYNNIVIIYNQ